jgi:hypothetical protein
MVVLPRSYIMAEVSVLLDLSYLISGLHYQI